MEIRRKVTYQSGRIAARLVKNERGFEAELWVDDVVADRLGPFEDEVDAERAWEKLTRAAMRLAGGGKSVIE